MPQSSAGSACHSLRCARRKPSEIYTHFYCIANPFMLQNSGNPKNRGIELAYGLPLVPGGAHRLPGFCAREENETGFLLGSEQIPGFTTTAGTPLSLEATWPFRLTTPAD
jgi:hypothetical protein